MERVPNESHQLLFAQTSYLSRGLGALRRIVTWPKTPALSLDYVPWVRYMVGADDLLEEASVTDQGLRRGGRLTRSMQSQVYTRYITLDEQQRSAIDALAFDSNDF